MGLQGCRLVEQESCGKPFQKWEARGTKGERDFQFLAVILSGRVDFGGIGRGLTELLSLDWSQANSGPNFCRSDFKSLTHREGTDSLAP